MTITGDMLIGFSAVRGTEGSQRAFNPASNSEISEPSFGMGGAAEVERAASLAAQAFDVFRNVTLAKRAAFLDAIADNILGIGDELIERAHAETGLPITRLQGERGRTVGQLRLFAKVVRDGHFLSSTIDHAQPERQPLPRADLRLAKVPVGPVAVFGASNFPLAFSVAGGDTASALAAGAPVIVKAHGAHLGTSELVGRAIQKAVRGHGLPEGVFSLLFGAGRKLGEALVAHPVIKAVGFTGSRQGGLALVRIANARAEPIPVYAEMSSINPVFLFPGALASRAEAIGKAFADSLTLGAGQFCTNPGLVLAIDGPDLDRFIKAAGESLAAKPAQTMLTPGIFDAFRSGAQKVDGVQGVTKVAQGVSAGEFPNAAQAALYVTDAQRLLATPELEAEMFGPASVVIRAHDFDELLSVAEHVEGQLTVTLQIDAVDYADAQRLLPILERKAGRILANGFPTGVEVCNAMVHGGPFPSTSNPMFTSVGATAIDRFLRPVCYQDLPDALLPAAVREGNPLAVWRLVDGELTGGARDNGDSVAGPGDSGSKPQFLIVHPRNEESYWQPVPANGYASAHVAPHLVSMQRPFSAGTQTVPPGGFVRLHAHAESEEVLHFIRGKGKAVVEGRDYLIEPGMTIFLGPQQSHTLINDGAEDLHWVWFFLPSGLETFFKAIGRQRSPGDDAPDVFERPENVSTIEASTGFSPVTQRRLG